MKRPPKRARASDDPAFTNHQHIFQQQQGVQYPHIATQSTPNFHWPSADQQNPQNTHPFGQIQSNHQQPVQQQFVYPYQQPVQVQYPGWGQPVYQTPTQQPANFIPQYTAGAGGDDGEDQEISFEDNDSHHPHHPHNALSPHNPPHSPHAAQIQLQQQTQVMNSSPKLCPLSPQSIGEIISQLTHRVTDYDAEIAKIGQEIRGQPTLPFPREFAEPILHYLGSLRTKIQDTLRETIQLLHRSLVPFRHMHQLDCFQIDFLRQFHSTDLYIQEVTYLHRSHQNNKIFAFLCIINHPCPTTVKQYGTLNPIEVRLLTGAKSQINVLSNVKAEMAHNFVSNPNPWKTKALEGDEETFKKGVAVFSKIQLLVGSGVKTVQLRFSVQLQQLNGETRRIESPPSEAFIVLTNTKQWIGAQMILLKRHIFSDRTPQKSQHYFCNCVHQHLLEATRHGSPLNLTRTLVPNELHFLMNQKLQKGPPIGDVVSQHDFDDFWVWFGAALQKIRFTKFLLPFWNKGLFWGFVSKDQSEKILQTCDVGAFLLRFSESAAGAIAVAYKQGSRGVRHYLLKESDFIQGRSLPQFIKDATSLRYFLQISTQDDFQMHVSLAEKNVVLKEIGFVRRQKQNEEEETGDYYDGELLMID